VTDLYLPPTAPGAREIAAAPLAPTSLELFFLKQLNLPKELSLACEQLSVALLIILFNIAIGILCHRYLFDELPLVDSIYLSVITITTLGYGDIVPRTTSSRGFTILYSIVGVISTAKAITLINDAASKWIIYSHTSKRDSPQDTRVDPPNLTDASTSGGAEDGTPTGEEAELFLDRNEFVLQKLTKMGIITPELRAQVEDLFAAMDVAKAGLLSNHDIAKFSDLIRRESFSQRPDSPYLHVLPPPLSTLAQPLPVPHALRDNATPLEHRSPQPEY
jgi:hypothetical protein